MHFAPIRPSQELWHAVRNLMICLFLMLAVTSGARAHELAPAVGDLTFDREAGEVQLALRVNLEAILAGIEPEHDNTDDSANAGEYDDLRNLSPAELTARFRAFEAEFLSGLDARLDGASVATALSEINIPEAGDIELVRSSQLVLTAPMPDAAKTYSFSWDRNFGEIVLRALDAEREGYVALLANGNRSDDIVIGGLTPVSGWATFFNYIAIGFDHIVPLGADHILFVVGLFLLSARLRPLLAQVTAFTLAHTVTLAMGMLGWVSIPGSIVEPLIAASIVYVAVENIARPTLSPWRPAIVFGFGLLHGLGFAGVLTEFGMPEGQFIAGLIGFNIGVELGQLAVIAACFAAFGYWFGAKSWYRPAIVIPGSLFVAIVGAYWFLERTVL